MTAIVSHPACRAYDPGRGHPDVPGRLDAIYNQLIASGLDFVCRHWDAPEATREQLLRVHGAGYLDDLFARAPATGEVDIDDDTWMTPGTLTAALHAAGAVVFAVDLVMTGKTRHAFCPVRPPGHHAERDRAMGFCFFDNVAVGAAHALAAHGAARVAIVDIDAHHGNGTEDIFAGDPRVLLCNSFQHPFYPHTGQPCRTDRLVNLALAEGQGGAAFRAVATEAWLPAIDAFAPDLLMISAGFDAHQQDDMSGLALTDPDFAWITRELRQLADRHAQGRIVSVLEGGYVPDVLARSVVAHLRALMD
jgi:acetoin utilization deacetylase AcuC-like enzyme